MVKTSGDPRSQDFLYIMVLFHRGVREINPNVL